MEDVLELYAEPRDPARPVVCFDEASKELRGDVAEPVPPAPGSPAKQDYEYTRHGTANLFVIVEPLAGRRHVTVTDRRTIPDFAAQMKYLCDEMYPEAEVIRVVLDNLNTHALGSLFATYPPEEAWRLRRRLEFHHTPKHASWLNMAEMRGAERAGTPMPGPSPGEQGRRGGGGHPLGGGAEPCRGQARVELPGRRRPPEARPPLSTSFYAVNH